MDSGERLSDERHTGGGGRQKVDRLQCAPGGVHRLCQGGKQCSAVLSESINCSLGKYRTVRNCRKITDATCAGYFFEVKLLKQLSENVGAADCGETF